MTMTQEIEKGTVQLNKLNNEKNRLMAISINNSGESVQQGSVVITNHEKFYLSVSIGAVTFDGDKYQTISASSPIGQLLLNKKQGEKFHLHDKEYVIEDIL